MTRQTFLFVAAVLALATHAAAQGPPPANARLDRVIQETVGQQRAATGQIVSLRRADVATQEAGLIESLDLNIGDTVEKGQTLARLDDLRAKLTVDRLKARVRADEAVVNQRAAELAQAERDYQRFQKLSEMGSVGESELDDASTLVQSRKAILAEAEANLATDQADLSLAERTLQDMTIKAPFAGRVVRKHTELGQWVSIGSPILTIVSLTDLEARADIPERSVGALRGVGTTIEIDVPALGERLTGTLIEIVPDADSLSRLFPIRVKVSDPKGRLRPGMSLSALVPTGEVAPSITISEDAIIRGPAGEFVYFDAGGMSQVAPIVRLFSANNRVVIRSPVLRPGMLVVTEGNERMFPGQPLNVLNADQFPEVLERQAQQQQSAPGGPPSSEDSNKGEG
ncbi:MAG: efflux RND transporter periplasmic adaptor subunit [Phycisphaerales bacterium]